MKQSVSINELRKACFKMTAEDYTPQQIATLAQRAAEAEHALPALLAILKYPWSVFWSLAISMCVIMEGYDTSLVLNFYAYPVFARKFGRFNEDSDNYQLEPHWQVSLSNAGYAGSFLGTWLTGYVVDKFGHVKVLVGALLALGGFIFIVFFAPSTPVLLVGQFLCGLPWGIFASTAPAYASEVLPMSLRVYMTSWTNMCFIIGQLVAAGALAGLVNLSNDWSYRIPLAVQWLWPAILIPIIWHAPDTPWHFVRQKRYDDAKSSLQRLRPRSSDAEIRDAVGLMVYTNHIEQEVSLGTSYWDCFKGVDRRRTEIACIVFAGQILSGFSFAHNSTYFF
jgi:MFS transporter, SP family, general alpha glucoside:H+ symporter